MSTPRLSGHEVADFMRGCPGELCDLILALRDLVLEAAPKAGEKIAFHSLCYYKPGSPYGVIGGNICGIGWRGDTVFVSFIHGSALPDPQGRLEGRGKAMRNLPLRTEADIPKAYLKKLIRAAVKYSPTEKE